MTQTISTIVDSVLASVAVVVYMTQTISTIVDWERIFMQELCLYDPNNFYYCRLSLFLVTPDVVYMTQTISTIVDIEKYDGETYDVYMTQTISTIVDSRYIYRLSSRSI